TATTVVTISSTPIAPVITSTDVELCEGETFNLGSTTQGTSYSWTGPNGFTSSSQYPSAITASTATAGTYSLSVQTVGGCVSDVATIEITVNPLPSTPVLNVLSNNVCEGDAVVLTTNAVASDYLWIASSGDTITTQVPSLTVNSGSNYVSGNWTLVVGNSNGCLSNNSNNQAINLYANPNAIASNNGPVCNGGTVTLTGNTATSGTYEWYDENYTTLLSTNAVHSINNMSAGTYTYNYILNVNGCVDTATTVVTINATLTAPDITSTDVELCEGGVFSLGTSTVAGTYTWTGPNGFTSSSQYPQAITASSVTAGTYNLSVSTNGCGSADTSITIVVNPLPAQPTITGTTSICLGDTLKLMTSSTCGTYKWIGPGGSSVTTLSNPLLTTSTNYTYIPSTDSAYAAGDWSVICISAEGCESPMSSAINVNIIQVPDTVYAASNSPVCEGGSINLTTNGVAGASYSWTGPNGYSSTVQNPVINNAQAIHNGDYSVELTFNGCSSRVSIPTTVVVNPIPATPQPTSNSALCESDTLFLFANNTGNTYQWTGPNGFSSTLENPFIVNATSANQGFYNLTITENGCSSAVGQVQVDIINSNYVPTISSNVTDLCEGDDLILNTTGFSGGNASYVWYGPSGVLDTTANPTYINSNIQVSESGNYYVEVLTGICSSLPSQLVMINVNPTPPVPNITGDTVVCEGDVIQLYTNTVATQYSWTGPNGFTSSLQNPQVISSATLSDAGLYSLSVEVNGCFSSDSTVNITVNPKPQTPALFSNSPICVGNDIILSTPNVAANYEWTLPDASVVVTTNDTLIITPATMADQGSYSLRIETNGCYSDAVSVEVSIDDPTTAIAYAGDDMIVCDGAPSVNLSAVNNGTGFWETTSSAVIVTPFDHNTTVTNLQTDSSYVFVWTLTQGACGGLSTDTLLVNVPGYPVAVGDSAILNENGSVLVDVLANDSYSFPVNLNPVTTPNYGFVTNNNNQLNYENTGITNGDQFIYEICLEDCPSMCDTAYVNIVVNPLINVPDIITPNGDGKNDAFVIEGIENYPNNEFYIFNRWGNEVYSTDDYQNDWDGTRNGKELPDGTYFYVFNNKDTGELIINGYITLHR
ncbi:Ig-like domain-containing protein, partial [Brumimicrobium mesophilum]|uniref:Ig-like domain-containing protein n=1 Tax=Brumimicrobium mesophilum TaxID=392717 RepID=UPI00131BD05F